jgi:hypothetical protein
MLFVRRFRVGWVSCVVVVGVYVLFASGCGPSEERIGCLAGCAREKDACILAATTPAGIQECDSRGARCSEGCPH